MTHDTRSTSFDMASTFAVLGPHGEAVPVDVTPTLYEDLGRRFDGFKGHHLVSEYRFNANWPTWEMHPAGDEIVCLLEGEAVFVLERRDGTEDIIELNSAGSYVIVPKGTWHTARIADSARMLFITPGEGTEHREKP
jgi:mannose-6-phosphate isomerase-like protein (cupin superfamily)